jgi:hypothetical protein
LVCGENPAPLLVTPPNRLAQYPLAQSRLDIALSAEVDFATEKRLEQLLRIEVIGQGRLIELDEEIDIAGIGRVAAHERAEEGELSDAQLAETSLIRADRGQDVVAGHARLWYLGEIALTICARRPGRC